MRKNTWMIGAVLAAWVVVSLADALGLTDNARLIFSMIGGGLGGWLASRLTRGA